MWDPRTGVKKLLTPVTIMFVPHNNGQTVSLRVPVSVLCLMVVFFLAGSVYVYDLLERAIGYESIKGDLASIRNQYQELESSMDSLKMADSQFKELFAKSNPGDVLESVDFTDTGSLDMHALGRKIERVIEDTPDIQKYMSSTDHDLFSATPLGWPTDGELSSRYGEREHPVYGTEEFHSGVDISARPGTKVRATADGIVSFAGRSGASGNLVAVEHGYGYRTYYAHNKKNNVEVGQTIRRGDVIAYVGSTGGATGPHLHYEIWKSGASIDPVAYIKGGVK